MTSNMNYQQFNGAPRRESMFKLVPGQLTSGSNYESYWASKGMITLSVFQMGFGVSMIILQVLLNGQYFKLRYLEDCQEKRFAEAYALVCGVAIMLVGIFGICTSSLKSRCLAFLTTILYLLGYAASIVCCAASIGFYNSLDDNLFIKGISIADNFATGGKIVSATYDTVKAEFLILAAIGGINFILSITTSALICRGCCTCCHTRTQLPLYMVRTNLSPSTGAEVQGL